jgi:hypothetical protein
MTSPALVNGILVEGAAPCLFFAYFFTTTRLRAGAPSRFRPWPSCTRGSPLARPPSCSPAFDFALITG